MTTLEKLDLIFTLEKLESEKISTIHYDPDFYGHPRLEIVYSQKNKRIYKGSDKIELFLNKFFSEDI